MVERSLLFSNVRALILCGFSGFSKASANIIHKNINKGGGQAEVLQGKAGSLLDYTHIIVPQQAEAGKLASILGIGDSGLADLLLVGQNWAIDSVRFQQIQDTDMFRWRPRPIFGENESIPTPQKRAKIDSGERTPPREPEITPPEPSPAKSVPSDDPVLSDSGGEDDVSSIPADFDDLLQLIKTQQTENRFVPRRDLTPVSSKTQDYWERQKHKFQFAKESVAINHNEHITSVLEKLMKNYELLRDKGRFFAYRDAVIRLKAYPEQITNAEQVRGMYRFGKKLMKKIEEILETGTLRRAEAMEGMQYLKSIKDLSTIWGIGTATADKLFKLGYRSVADLRAKPSPILNASQSIGLEFYEEFLERMSREEVKAICDQVETVAKTCAGSRTLNVVPCGSYRRGRPTCGDADVLMAFEDMESTEGFLNQVVSQLMATGLITHRLQISDHWESTPGKKHSHEMFAGVAQLPGGKHRRLDIKIYPRQVFAWALLHFTGSANFNRSIRLFAKKKGFKLTDEGFFPTIRDHGEPLCDDYTPNSQLPVSLYPWVTPRTLSISDPLIQLHEEILDFWTFTRPSPAELETRNSTFSTLSTVATDLWPGCELKQFGSLETGLWIPNSDMDVVILTHREEDAKRLICQLAKELDLRCMISHQERVLRAHVPILKIRDKTTALRVDICFNTENGMEGVMVMREYLGRYPEVKYLVCVLKYFLRQRGLNETYYGGVGSFLLFWTVVAATQHHRSLYKRHSGFTLAHYFLHYLRFIGLDLDFEKYGLDISQGGSFPKDVNYPKDLLALRCPLDPERTIGQSSFHFPTVRNAFASAYKLLCAQTFRVSNLSPLGCLIKADRSLLERT